MATPTYGSGLLNDFWTKYYNRRTSKGAPLSSREMFDLYEPIGMYEAQKAEAAGERARIQGNLERELALREKQAADAASAAKVSGVLGMAGTAGNLYLGKKLLDVYGAKHGATPGAVAPGANPATLGMPEMAPSGISTSGIPTASAVPEAAAVSPSITAGTSGAEWGSGIGAQSQLSGAYEGLAGAGAQAKLAAPFAEGSLGAYDAALAEGAAEGVGSTAGTTAASLGADVLGYVAPPAIGWGVGSLVDTAIDKFSPIGGAKEKSIAGNIAKGAGIGAGVGSLIPVPGMTLVGGAAGGIIGGIVGAVEDVSVICTELHRQGLVSDSEMRWVRKFRREHVSGSTYTGYLRWATPIVRQMRKEGTFNRMVRPLALSLVHQWINIAKGQRGSVAQRAVYAVAYAASRVAYYWCKEDRGSMRGLEVRHG